MGIGSLSQVKRALASTATFGGKLPRAFLCGLGCPNGWLVVPSFLILDGTQLGHCHLLVLSDHPCLLSAGAADLGHVWVGWSCIRRGASCSTGRSRHLRRRLRRRGGIVGRSGK